VANITYTGTLALLAPSYAGTPDYSDVTKHKNPFIFLLTGWPSTTTSRDLLGARNDTSFLPPVVTLEFPSVLRFRKEDAYRHPEERRTNFLPPLCEVGNTTRETDNYGFTCEYQSLDREIMEYLALSLAESQFAIPIPLSNSCSSNTVKTNNSFIAQNTERLSVRGSFNPTSADFAWEGRFKGGFSDKPIKSRSIAAQYILGDEPNQRFGDFRIGFRGEVDEGWSHEMVLGDGASVDWVEDVNKTKAVVVCAAKSMAVGRGGGLWGAGIVVAGWSVLWAGYL
jgi:hypothetical protein